MQFEGIYTKVKKGGLKDEMIQSLQKSAAENPIHCNFFELGGKVLQAIQSPSIIGISNVERTASNILIHAPISAGQSLPTYLASQSSISDELFAQIIDQLTAAVSAVHGQGFYHQALNPTSFWVTDKGTIQLGLFETLEMRFCQQSPDLLRSNDRLRFINRFLSPERQKDPKTVAFSDEYYSFGLIAWYIWCFKVGRITPNSDVQSVPDFESTGTSWDRLWNACLNANPANRPNSLVQFQTLISDSKPELKKNTKAKETSTNEVDKDNEKNSFKNNVVLYNYSADDYHIRCDHRPITNLFKIQEGTTLTLYNIPGGVLVEIFKNSDETLLSSFNTSDQQEYSLPILSSKPENISMEKKSSLSVGQVGLILGALIIVIGVVLYLKLSPPTPPVPPPPSGVTDPNGPAFAMVPPEGYTIVDTNNNDLLRNTGFMVEGTKWRFKEENWERFVLEGSDDTKGKWVKDNSQKVNLIAAYFEKIEEIESEGELPPNQELIKGNDSLLYHYGKKALDGVFYRFVNNRWYKKEGGRWKKILSFEDYKDVLETYFVDVRLLQNQPMAFGYVQGEHVRYRSEPSDRNRETILGYFKDYKTYSDGSPLSEYENTRPDYVSVLFEKNGWYLVQISENSKIAWMSKQQFVSEPVCYAPTIEEDENP
jgi:serine/threonine protein kinase